MTDTKDLWFFLLCIGALFALWLYTGGPERESARKGPFIRPPAPLDSGNIYGDAVLRNNPNTTSGTPARGTLEIVGVSGARTTNPAQEYIELRASYANTGPIDATNWRVGDSSGSSFVLGGAVKIPRGTGTEAVGSLFLSPGDRLIVATGRSPVGVSFQENSCTGYFEQFQDFSPSLTRSCPDPLNDYGSIYGSVSSACRSFLGGLDRCEMVTEEIPSNVERDCSDFARQISYVSCIANHETEKNFYKASWRVFLGRSGELWSGESGLVLLYNPEGALVDTERYR